MKGLVFTEFLEMVESAHGMDTTDQLLDVPALASGGAYTAVGTYDAAELFAMVARLAELHETPVDDLLIGFGEHLFTRFHGIYPQMFEGKVNAIDFLKSVHGHIHVEVRKLYPEADLPEFTYLHTSEGLIMTYTSKRPLARFGLGLVRGCLDHFGGSESVTCELQEPFDGTAATFRIK
jgi:hypothetical protein